MKHLNPEELLAFREGRLESPEREEHLAACRKCRGRVEDLRWQETLLGKGQGTAVEEHPGRDEIAGYLQEALFPGEVERLKFHFQACDRCMALYSKMRRESAASPVPLTSIAQIRKIKRRFRRPAGSRSLGVLVLEMVKGMSLRFLPLPQEPLPAAGPSVRSSLMDGRMGSMELRREVRGATVDPEPARSFFLESDLQTLSASPAEDEKSVLREEPASTEPPASPPVDLDAGPWRLSFSAAGGPKEPALEIVIRDRQKDRPAPGVLFEMIRAETVASRVRSDGNGRLSLAVPRGDCRLQVGEESRFTLRLLTIG